MSQKYFSKTDSLMYFLARVWFLILFHFFFFPFLSWFKIIFWNATFHEKTNAVVSNISCFSVSRQVKHIGFSILYKLGKGLGLYSQGLGLYSVDLVLKLSSSTVEYLRGEGCGFQEHKMPLCYSHATAYSDT